MKLLKFTLISFFMMASNAHPSIEECDLIYDYPLAKTVDETIEQSEHIGIYLAQSVTKKEGMVSGNSRKVQLYEIEFRLQKSLTNDSPDRLYVISEDNALDKVPSYFFSLFETHKEIVENDSLFLGRSSAVTYPDGSCGGSATVVTGYEYLIFGGANSQIAFEPILDRRYDPLYEAVVQKVRIRGKGR